MCEGVPGGGGDCSNIKLFVERVQVCSVLRVCGMFARYFQTFSRFCNIIKPREILLTYSINLVVFVSFLL